MEATAAAAGPALSASPKPARVRRLPTRAASGRIALPTPSSPGSPHLGDGAAVPSPLSVSGGNGGGSGPGSPLAPISSGACTAASRSGGTASGLLASPRRSPACGEDGEPRSAAGADGGCVAGPRLHAADDDAFDTRGQPNGDPPMGPSAAAAAAAAAAATSDVARDQAAAVALGAETSDSASGGVAALAAQSPIKTANQPVASLPPPSADPPSNGNPGPPPPPAPAPFPARPPSHAGAESAGGSLSGAGPLNASATLGVAAALPIKRRGSYQGMKARAGGGTSISVDSVGGSSLKSENPPSLMDLVARKRTHWECFGTILVLCCMDASEGFGRQVLQMLQAEGYDTRVVANMADALAEFSTRDALPDVVLVDCGMRAFSGTSLISKLQVRNPTVAILCMGTGSGPVTAVSALQAGAADFVSQPVDLDELVVRIERHVQRQHCLKLEMESVLEAMGSLAAGPAAKPGGAAAGRRNGGGGGGGAPALIAVAEETDFELQITELSEENARLMATLQQMQARLSIGESEKALLHTQLHSLEVRQKLSEGSLHTYGEKVGAVTDANSSLAAKVEALERMVMDSREAIASLTQGGGSGIDNAPCSLLDSQCSEVQDL